MRLLECNNAGKTSLTEVPLGHDAPPYAILSHTWGTQEVSFKDLRRGKDKNKLGYRKIRFCRDQALRDSLQYFWVDTCCIDKSNNTELQEAINSMFRWYHDAAKCYVYLADVSTPTLAADDNSSWEPAFRKSKWFTRGWTLQELIAPTSVEFFSKEGVYLGNKISLERHIYDVTGIPITALRGSPLSNFSISERMAWAEKRNTTRKEDKAYALLGIFNIYMPLIYGEGEENAFRRLRKKVSKTEDSCLSDLRITDPRSDKSRIENTKGGLLKDCYRWILEHHDFLQWRDDEHSRLLWIKGDPGKGKTMLLCGIINELSPTTKLAGQEAKTLLSYFFCQATDERIRNATAVLRGLIYLLAEQESSLISYIEKQYKYAGKALFEDINAWTALLEIFTSILNDRSLEKTYVIIDALDECVVDLPKLLDFIDKSSSLFPRVKWLVSSRNWPDIEMRLEVAAQKVRLCLELNERSISAAISIYIKHNVDRLARLQKYDDKTRSAVEAHLFSNANDTFLWVSLVCQALETTKPWNIPAKLTGFVSGLDPLYERMMEQIRRSDSANLCKRILALVSTVFRPLTTKELETLEDIPGGGQYLPEIIGECGSFLALREGTVHFVHQSAQDFLRRVISGEIFPWGVKEEHHLIFSTSLRAMSLTLRRDMYRLRMPGFPIEKVKPPDPDPLAGAAYSCVYWTSHLDESTRSNPKHQESLQDGGMVDTFIRHKYIYWLEALSLLKKVPEGVLSMTKLERLLRDSLDTSNLIKLVQDARRFILYHKLAIEGSPLQVYASALVFSPALSMTRTLFEIEEPVWIARKPTMENNWSARLQTLEGHRDRVDSIAFSPDSKHLASASRDHSIKIWDATTGTCLHTLEGCRGEVELLTFSPDSLRLASASDYHSSTIEIWEVATSTCLHILKGCGGAAFSVAFSPDSKRLASVWGAGTLIIWDLIAGTRLQTFEYGWFSSVVLPSDLQRLASASARGSTIDVRDTTYISLGTFEGSFGWVNTVTFSPDSKRLTSASGPIIKIWDVATRTCLQTLQGHRYLVRSLAFSPDSQRLASASDDRTVKVWDVVTSTCLQTFEGHRDIVKSVAFSPDSQRLASASADGTVKMWDVTASTYPQTLEGHGDEIESVTSSPDLQRIASKSRDGIVKVWDVAMGTYLQTLEADRDFTSSLAFSPDSQRLVLKSSDSDTIKIWDIATGTCLQTLESHHGMVGSVAFSPDSQRITLASNYGAFKVWDVATGACLQTFECPSFWVASVAFSPDSKRLAFRSSAWTEDTIKVWDVATGTCLYTLEGFGGDVNSVAFSPDSKCLASVSSSGTVKIWDAAAGTCLQTLNTRGISRIISFDPTGLYLHTNIGTVSLSPASNAAQSQCTSEKHCLYGYGVSADHRWITRNSENLLWLPPEYRPTCWTVAASTVAIGCASGRVLMIKFRSGEFQLHN